MINAQMTLINEISNHIARAYRGVLRYHTPTNQFQEVLTFGSNQWRNISPQRLESYVKSGLNSYRVSLSGDATAYAEASEMHHPKHYKDIERRLTRLMRGNYE